MWAFSYVLCLDQMEQLEPVIDAPALLQNHYAYWEQVLIDAKRAVSVAEQQLQVIGAKILACS